MCEYYLGIDVGGTKCAVVLADSQLAIVEKIIFATSVIRGSTAIIKEFFEHSHFLIDKHKANISAIGVSCGGPLDSKKGIILYPPNLPGWDEVPIVKLFSEEFKVPVFLQNDANASALAEWKFGAGRGCDNIIFLTFGTGMGAGLILNGKLYSGTNDMAGEVGHIRMTNDGPIGYGKLGSFEGYCSGGGIAQLAKRTVEDKLSKGAHVGFCSSVGELENITAKRVGEEALKGDPLAIEIINESGRYLGIGLSILIDVLNPERIVIGSIYNKCEALFRPIVEEIIAREALPQSASVCKIVPAQLDDQIGDFASLCVAKWSK